MKSMTVLAVLGFAVAAQLPVGGIEAAPLSPRDVPASLKPWMPWVLHGHEEAFCPPLAAPADEDGDDDDAKKCAWPARLRLSLDEKAGRFEQEWQIYKQTWVPLPGSSEHWPLDVRDRGGAAVVVEAGGDPGVILEPGRHTITGAFVWDSMPESLSVPPATGILSLVVRGTKVPFPERGADGEVFLERTVAQGEEDALDITVHRKVTDDIPLLLTTRVTLSVSGKSRELLLGRSLPDGFVPLSLESPLPVRIEPDSRLRIQVRPGRFTVEIVARHEGPTNSLTRPDAQGPWQEGDEVWVFDARPNLRVAAVASVPAIDPQQTTLPDEWKSMQAYAMSPGATMRIEESRRGDSDPAPDRLSLSRTLWLDFDGGGYTVSDEITGSMHRSWRMEMNPPASLGRVTMGGRDQLITRLTPNARAGVEIRQGKVALLADSRLTGGIRDIPTVGWDNDFEQVSTTLHLPPGWRLFHAAGADRVAPTWVKSWTLYDLFLLVLITLATMKLFGGHVGVLALLALVLVFPEDDAPKNIWLAILAGEALLMLLPKPGKLRSLLRLYLAGVWLVFAVIAIPFLVQQVRQGLHPAQERRWTAMSYETSLSNIESQNMRISDLSTRAERWQAEDVDKRDLLLDKLKEAEPADEELAEQTPAEVQRHRSVKKEGLYGLRGPKDAKVPPPPQKAQQMRRSKLNVQDYDPNAMVQTGPGLPAWTWRQVDMRWNGPVQRSEHLRLMLLGPRTNLVLMVVRVALLLLTVLMFLRPPRVGGNWWWRTAAASAVLLVGLLSGSARAGELPDKEMLDELREKLTEAPECAPHCATISRLQLDVSPRRLQVRLEAGAASASAVPLPGGRDQWVPERVNVDGRLAAALVRSDDGVLFVELEPGGHVIVMEGALPGRDTVQLSLPMRPHLVTVKTVGWTVAGVHEDGIADADLQLARIQKGGEGTGAALRPNALPPHVRVERTLVLGLRWEVDTSLVRQSPLGSPIVLEVPLLPGESVTTPGIRVSKGKALVNMGAQESELTWPGTLAEQAILELRAPQGVPWVEVWRLDASPVWHTVASGIPPVHQPTEQATRLPEWRPWPGEKLRLDSSRPLAVPGQTLTIQGSRLLLRPGLRASDAVLSMQVRSSRGGQHTLILPAGAELKSVKVNGSLQPIRQNGERVTLPITPGQQQLEIAWREAAGLRTFFRAPTVDVQSSSVNSEIRIHMGKARWILFLGGPTMGPSVLWWSLILALFIVALALGRTSLTPLKSHHWVLLGLGLSQVSVVAAAVVVAWLLAFGWRRRRGSAGANYVFDLIQVGLAVLSLVALVILFRAVESGLLRHPDMGISGNQSTAAMLSWFQDRSGPVLARPWVLSVPLLVYRSAMLLWAVWLATSLLRWSRWLWACFVEGGFWQRIQLPGIRRPPSPPSPPSAPPPT